ncbi:hypothetical protein [Erythrobacter sp. Alg231-14]|uniref:hypothetical protein n=1 Tax=Erythrobacter sp. Alg231-14 TaxID=1922225 RepID=UPI00307C4A28
MAKRTSQLHCLARIPALEGDRFTTGKKKKAAQVGKALLADQYGRLFLVDPTMARVTQF